MKKSLALTLIVMLCLIVGMAKNKKVKSPTTPTDAEKITKLIAFKKDFTANVVALQATEKELFDYSVPAVQMQSGGKWVCLQPFIALGKDASNKPVCKAGRISVAEHTTMARDFADLLEKEAMLQKAMNAEPPVVPDIIIGLNASDASMQKLLDDMRGIKNPDSRATLQSLALPAKSTLVTAKAIVQ